MTTRNYDEEFLWAIFEAGTEQRPCSLWDGTKWTTYIGMAEEATPVEVQPAQDDDRAFGQQW